MNCRFAVRRLRIAQRTALVSCRRLYESPGPKRASSFTSPSVQLDKTDDIMAIDRLQEQFNETSNGKGVFPLLNEKQMEAFQKRVKWGPGSTQAAVLVLLCNVGGRPSIVFTKRAAHLSQHPAEISFPGGHVEESETFAEAALRETCEELLPPKDFLSNVHPIGRTSQLPSIRGTPVTAVVAVSPTPLFDLHKIFPGNPNEVDQVFSVSIADLVRNERSHVISNSRFGDTPAPWYASPHGRIWGLTAFILRPLLHKIFKPIYVSGDD